MPTPTRLIFGIRTSQTTQLDIRGAPPETTLPLRVSTRNQGETTRPCVHGTWTVSLPPGDHLIRITAGSHTDLFKGPLEFTVTPEAMLVFYGQRSPLSPGAAATRSGTRDVGEAQGTLAWTASGSTAVWPSKNGTGNDPKDPWPPPGIQAIALLEDAEWLTSTLRKANADIDISRG